jgi:hypothetical protein
LTLKDNITLRETKSGGTIKRFAAKWKPVLVHPFANTDQRPRLPKASRRTAGCKWTVNLFSLTVARRHLA